uniref:Uncharacterized protein n=1 Tax=Geospiza parvula TaxID=87175 RepID=A0A8C3MIL6_GEOPR
MSIAASNTSMRVPAGFRNLLEGLAREVLREQPTDVVAFAAQYFQKLLESREATLAPWSHPVPAPLRPRTRRGSRQHQQGSQRGACPHNPHELGHLSRDATAALAPNPPFATVQPQN